MRSTSTTERYLTIGIGRIEQMLATQLRIHHLPEPYASMIDHQVVPCYTIDEYTLGEFVAHLNGKGSEKCCVRDLTKFIQKKYPRFEVGLDEAPERFILVEGTDVSWSMPRESLRRRFHFFDDYLSEFPDADKIVIPLSHDESSGLYSDRIPSHLHASLDGLKYFNPKSALEYFQLDPSGVSDEELEKLVALLTEEEVINMVEARYLARPQPYLPRMGSDRPALACILEAWRQSGRIARLFPSYPSYVVLSYSRSSKSERRSYVRSLLINFDFSQSREVAMIDGYVSSAILSVICDALATVETREGASKLLAMLDLRCEVLESEGMSVAAPYRVRFAGLENVAALKSSELRDNLERLFDRPFPERWVSVIVNGKDEDGALFDSLMGATDGVAALFGGSSAKNWMVAMLSGKVAEEGQDEEKRIPPTEIEAIDLDAIDFDD